MGGSKKPKRSRHSHYRAPVASRVSVADMLAEDSASGLADVAPDVEDDAGSTRPLAALTSGANTGSRDEPPTIILTPDQIALLSRAKPPQTIVPAADHVGYAYNSDPTDNRYDAPTIILDVGALLAAPPPPIVQAPAPPDPVRPLPTDSDVAWRESLTPTRKRRRDLSDPDQRLAELHRIRSERAAGLIDRAPDEPYISDKLRQWWTEIQPGIDRVLGRSHRAGTRGARATAHHTSSQLPVVRVRELDEAQVPAIHRLSHAARQIGARAQTAAAPALAKLHSRAERVAQQIVDRIDEKLGGRPPMQNVLLGPGRMIVSFNPSVSIRDAQIIITSVQARSLRGLHGHNAYLVMVPPGREAKYAERLHAYRQVTGVHFGPQRAPVPAHESANRA